MRNYKKKNNAWNIRHLTDDSFVQANQQTRVLYCRLTDFKAATTNPLKSDDWKWATDKRCIHNK